MRLKLYIHLAGGNSIRFIVSGGAHLRVIIVLE